jgi:predicted alpha/beta-hydrolase family hydrolase
MERVRAGLSTRGITVVTFDFPYRVDGRRVPDKGPVLEDAFVGAWLEARTAVSSAVRWFVGGKSMGGRIASQVLARAGFEPAPRGLVCFGYPLHPPGKPDQRRDRHLPSINAPVLFLQGTRDPFASADEMRALASDLRGASLELVDGGDHSLEVSRRQDPAGVAFDQALDRAAAWIQTRAEPL